MTTHRHFDAGDDLSLHAEVEGDGPAAVLLHGFTGSTASWRHLTSRLVSRFSVIAVDLPGHGRSSAPRDPARYGLHRFADDLARLLDSLRLERIALLGYSLGGRAALQFALRHGDRLSALVLESASPGIADPVEREARAAADAELADFIGREGIEAFVDRWERLPLWASQSALPERSRAELRAQRLQASAKGLANSLRGAGAGSTAPVVAELAKFDMPPLLIAGALDAKYVAAARAMERAIPHARAVIVADAGHTVHLERPDEFAKVVEEFLATGSR